MLKSSPSLWIQKLFPKEFHDYFIMQIGSFIEPLTKLAKICTIIISLVSEEKPFYFQLDSELRSPMKSNCFKTLTQIVINWSYFIIAAESCDLMNGLKWICFIWAFTIVCWRLKLVTKAFHAALHVTPEYPSPAIAVLALPLTSVF